MAGYDTSSTQSSDASFADQCPNPDYVESPPPQTPWDPNADLSQFGPRVEPTQDDLAAAHGHYADDPTATQPYARAYNDGKSIGFGVGLQDYQSPDGDQSSVASVNLRAGEWQDGQGGTQRGIDGNAQVFRLGGTPGKDAGVHGEVGILDANVQVLHGDNETVIGAGANIGDYAVTGGSKDNNVRLGAGMGVGAAGRLHHSLDPETHKRSYGFGVDAGPISFDARTDVFSDEELAPTPDAPMVNPEDDDGGATFRQPITAYAEPATGG